MILILLQVNDEAESYKEKHMFTRQGRRPYFRKCCLAARTLWPTLKDQGQDNTRSQHSKGIKYHHNNC